MSFLWFLLATAHPALPSVPIDTAPEGFSDAEAAAVLRFANSFIDEQGSTDHASETARRCEEMIDTGNVQKAMRDAQVTYGLRTVEWKALMHDCSIYMLGIRKGADNSPDDTTPNR